jgi:polyphosphate kinase 2
MSKHDPSKKKSKKNKKSNGGPTKRHVRESELASMLHAPAGIEEFDRAAAAEPKMKRKEYERELRRLQGELVAMQHWVVATGTKVMVVFEGRDTAGKGGTIRRITERTNPRVFRHVALPAPTERQRSQMYIQRYMEHFPAAGEVVIFDRSWYNRAGVEPVMGFCTPEQSARFLEMVPSTEKAIVDAGIILIKYWLEVSADEQTRRLEDRMDDPRKTWKLSDMDLKSYSRWFDYSRARDAMFAATDTAWAPWFIANNEDKKRARLNIITHLLSRVPYEPIDLPKAELPERQDPGDYVEPNLSLRFVPELF